MAIACNKKHGITAVKACRKRIILFNCEFAIDKSTKAKRALMSKHQYVSNV
jgi:hypothetical protein